MEWIQINEADVFGIILSTIAIYGLLMLFIKFNGLRSFSKMSAHDFAVTIAIGSILASTVVNKSPTILQGALAIAMLLALQSVYSIWRIYRNKNYLENDPLLLMDGPTILKENLEKAKMTEDDLISKLREANVLNFEEVKAAVFEPTGDVSILHGNKNLDDQLLKKVRR